MPKKKKSARWPVKRKVRHRSQIGGYKTADLISCAELAKLRGVSDEAIRKAMKKKNAPAKVGRLWPRDLAIQFLDVREAYGGRAVDMMSPEEFLQTASGSVTPKPIEVSGAPTPAPLALGDEAGNVITATELLRLNPGELLKRKMAEEVIARRLANQERKRRLIPRVEFEERLFARAQQAIAFKRQMKLELPPKLVGLERPEVEVRIGEALDELFRRIATLGDPLTPAAGQAADQAVTGSPPPVHDAKDPTG